MSPPQNNRLVQAWLAIAFCICVAGCATPTTTGIASARDAQAGMVIGKSTKADVEAALGTAIVVSFDSGYEVWIYRERSAAGVGLFGQPAKERPELVLLFEPAGILKKTRVRVPAT
jgi:outer membrane protein assembly factor BamE (lipoprotein component of BamABCDE complex)